MAFISYNAYLRISLEGAMEAARVAAAQAHGPEVPPLERSRWNARDGSVDCCYVDVAIHECEELMTSFEDPALVNGHQFRRMFRWSLEKRLATAWPEVASGTLERLCAACQLNGSRHFVTSGKLRCCRPVIRAEQRQAQE